MFSSSKQITSSYFLSGAKIFYPPNLQDQDLLSNGKQYLQIMQGDVIAVVIIRVKNIKFFVSEHDSASGLYVARIFWLRYPRE
jgi:hypothetical protein